MEQVILININKSYSLRVRKQKKMFVMDELFENSVRWMIFHLQILTLYNFMCSLSDKQKASDSCIYSRFEFFAQHENRQCLFCMNDRY